MLFAIRHDLNQSRVFEGLNHLLREIMLAGLQGRIPDQNLEPNGIYAAAIGNQPTRNAADQLLRALAVLDQGEKDELTDVLLQNIDPCNFLADRNLQLPAIPDSIFPALKTLAVHLYERTAKLAGVEAACGECIEDYSARFRELPPLGNGNVCCVCGTEYLAQLRSDVDDHEQWRGPYDHLLAKDHYPLYGVHPRNLVPICGTCNSKAKLANDLLIKNDMRRLSFSPWTECALYPEIFVSIDDTEVFPRVVVGLASDDADRSAKLETWDDVYKIRARVEGEFRSMAAKLAEDLSAQDEVAFSQSLEQRAEARLGASRLSPFNYWRARLYLAVIAMDQKSRDAMRLAIANAMPKREEMKALFFP